MLASAIRILILRGIIYELIAGDFGTALQAYTRSYTLISLARAKWSKTDLEYAGTSLRRTFCECSSACMHAVRLISISQYRERRRGADA